MKKKGSKGLEDIVVVFIANFTICDVDQNSASLYGETRAVVVEKGTIIGSNDLFIASHVKALGAIFVTF